MRIGKRIAKWTTILGFLDYLILLMTALFSIIILANLQPINYGAFSLASTIYLLFSSLLQSFIVYPAIRIMSIHYENQDFHKLSGAITSAIILTTFLSLLLYFINALLSDLIAVNIFHSVELSHYIRLLAINIISNSLLGLIRGVFLSTKSYIKLAISRVMDGVLYITVIYLCVIVLDWSILTVSIGTDLYLGASLIISAILMIHELKKLKISSRVIAIRDNLSNIIKLGRFFIISGSVYYVFLRLDLLLIPQFIKDNTLIGYYAFAKNIIYRFRIFFTKINALLYPTFSGQFSVSRTMVLKKLLKAGIFVSLYLSVPFSLFLAMFSRELIIFLSFFIPKFIAYKDASMLFSIFSFMIIPYAINANVVAFFNGIGEVDKQVYANSILILSYLVAIPYLTLYLGIIGSTISYILAHYIRTLFWLILTNRKIHLNFVKYSKILIANVISLFLVFLIISLVSVVLSQKDLIIKLILIFLFSFILIYLFEGLLVILLRAVSRLEINVLKRILSKHTSLVRLIEMVESVIIKLHGESAGNEL